MKLQYIIILIWISFSLMCGIGEAFYFNRKRIKIIVHSLDIHFWFTLFRSIIAISLGIVIIKEVGLLESLLMGAIFIITFPFFHDGAYYTIRELLRKGTYPKYWFDQSTTTSAKFSFNITIRIILLILALIIFPY